MTQKIEHLEPFYCLDCDTCHSDCTVQVNMETGQRTIDEKVLSCMKAQCGLMPACIFVHPTKDIVLALNPMMPFSNIQVTT